MADNEKTQWAGQACLLANEMVDIYMKAKALAAQWAKWGYASGEVNMITDEDLEPLKGPGMDDLRDGCIVINQFCRLLEGQSVSQDDYLPDLLVLEIPNALLSRYR